MGKEECARGGFELADSVLRTKSRMGCSVFAARLFLNTVYLGLRMYVGYTGMEPSSCIW